MPRAVEDVSQHDLGVFPGNHVDALVPIPHGLRDGIELVDLRIGEVGKVGKNDVAGGHENQMVSRDDSKIFAIMSLARNSWALTVPSGRSSSSEISS